MIIYYTFQDGMVGSKWESYFPYHKELINEFLGWISPQDSVIFEVDIRNPIYSNIIRNYFNKCLLDKQKVV